MIANIFKNNMETSLFSLILPVTTFQQQQIDNLKKEIKKISDDFLDYRNHQIDLHTEQSEILDIIIKSIKNNQN
jgi:hypothetical protein